MNSKILHRFLSVTILSLILVTTFLLTGGGQAKAQYQRHILVEEFSTISCGACPPVAALMNMWVGQHPEYILISYVRSFRINGQKVPNNEQKCDVRFGYYDVPYVPYVTLNALPVPNEQYPGYPQQLSTMDAVIDTMTKSTPVQAEINFINNGPTGSISVTINSNIALQNKKLYVVLVEKEHVYDAQPNGMTDYHYLFRDIVNGSMGTNFSVEAGGSQQFEYDYSLPDGLNYDLYAIAFVQDWESKYIYQAESVFKESPISVKEIPTADSRIIIAPNPVENICTISTGSNSETLTSARLFDMTGRCIANYADNGITNSLLIDCTNDNGSSPGPGMYILQVITNRQTYYEHIIIR